MNTSIITRKLVAVSQRVNTTAKLFGMHFPMRLEPTVYAFADRLAQAYQGGYWEFYTLSNGGFYMAPRSEKTFNVSCENGYEGELSGDALGIAVCLYAYSHLSFAGDAFAEVCAEQYHLLREFALDHIETGSILRAID